MENTFESGGATSEHLKNRAVKVKVLLLSLLRRDEWPVLTYYYAELFLTLKVLPECRFVCTAPTRLLKHDGQTLSSLPRGEEVNDELATVNLN